MLNLLVQSSPSHSPEGQRCCVTVVFRQLEHEAWLERERIAQEVFRKQREREEQAQKEKEEREVM